MYLTPIGHLIHIYQSCKAVKVYNQILMRYKTLLIFTSAIQ